MNDDDLMPFGDYAGKKMANVPASYFLYLMKRGPITHEGVRQYVEDNRDVFTEELRREETKKTYYDDYYNN